MLSFLNNYLSDLEEIILSLFNREPYQLQPKYIADLGCGDGTLLKKIYEIIKYKSLCGKVLKKNPVKLIGIDLNERALQETALTLKDMDHLVLKGDVSDPQQLIKDLKKKGIQDTENILHLRSFLDHHHLYIPQADTSRTNGRLNIPGEGVNVDREGNEISAISMRENLVEHLQRWSSIIGRHGLIVQEVHCLEPETVSQFISQCESLHADSFFGFSPQSLVKAERFLMAAAEAGLFPNPDFFRKYPKTLPFTAMTLNHFERRDYRVRYAQEKDLPALAKLETQCWEPGLRRPTAVLKKRLTGYPDGQLALEMDNKVVGVIYSQRIANAEDVKTASITTVERLHREEGSIIQLLSINIQPRMQHLNLGDQLLEFMLQRCNLMNSLQKVIAVTKCKAYHKHTDTTPQEYIHLRNQQGRQIDPILRFHQLHGAQIKTLIPNYRLQDKNNKGYGVLVEYDPYKRQRNIIDVKGRYSERRVKAENTRTIESIEDFVLTTITNIIGTKKENGFSLQRPLMEMGLDSAHLLDLNEQISYKYQISLEPTFFFQYNTASRIISFLQEHVDPGTEQRAKKMKEKTHGKPTNHHKKDKPGQEIQDSSIQKQEIAIVGVSCRLPGGINNKEQLWELLVSGKDAISKLPPQRWNWPANIDPENDHPGIDNGGFLDEIAEFDASFFRISPKEAELMDPQQRILLELSWECLEDAGYPARLVSDSKTGVFIGASGSDYCRLLDEHHKEIDAHFGIGTSMAVLSNRISYFYNFFGPSIQIDTACSSSLVAVHEAVTSLQVGECEQALVGGINIMCHPSTGIAYYKAGMLAKDGRCKTFDKEADGYVRGEGAVMILLKPLAQALIDQDSIYAVIKGSAINHGGQASGLTVPNPGKQAALLIEAYKTAGIEPETVGYIEAHGTGTSLGDPIEISGLKKAFSQLSGIKGKTQYRYCGLGSIKTNIGHLEAAAGIAGLLKILLSMQKQMLPASLNFHQLNPHITLTQTPFYIVNQKQPWPLPQGQVLRRAGVSSFGSGGANAHVVLEEAPVVTPPVHRELPCYLICLSAKTEKALREKEKDLANWLEKNGETHHLEDISTTLLLGREHFEVRAAFVVKNVRELLEKLKGVIKNRETEGYFKESNPGKRKQIQPLFEEFSQTIIKTLDSGKKKSKQVYNNKLTALAELYVKGYDPDWRVIFKDINIHRIKLPTYPFARERYWLSDISPKVSCRTTSPANAAYVPHLHPLLHQNTSDIWELRFSSTFTGQEFFLADHVVRGQRILPGAAYLEMVRAAAARAVYSPDREENQTRIQLKNLVWVQPIVVEEKAVQVHIRLFPGEGHKRQIPFEIYTKPDAVDAEPVVHSQGVVELPGAADAEAPTLDLMAVQVQCCQNTLLSDQCYQAFRTMGIDYGPGHQGIEKLYVGSNQVLAKLSLPSAVSHTQNQFILHPSMVDSALQVSMGLMMFPGESGCGRKVPLNPALPFTLQELDIFGNCTSSMWALARRSDGSSAGDNVEKLDIDLYDHQGTPCVRMKGYSSRAPDGVVQSGSVSKTVPAETSNQAPGGTTETTGPTMLIPVWDPIVPEKIPIYPSHSEHVIMVGGNKKTRSAIQQYYPKAQPVDIQPGDNIETIAQKLEVSGDIDHIIWIAPHSPHSSIFTAGDGLIEEQNRGVLQVFRIIKALLGLGYGNRDLGWSVVTIQAQPINKNDPVNATHAGLYGLIGSMAKEYPNWKVRLIDLEDGVDWPMPEIFTLPPDPQGNALLYRNRQWYHQQLIPLNNKKLLRGVQGGGFLEKSPPGRVYVVIGGAGGIGTAWSEYMIRTYQARIIWIDRRQMDAPLRNELHRLATLGPAPMFIAADARNRQSMHQAYKKIKQRNLQVHGVIHSVILLFDQSLANMEEQQFQTVLSAKVDVSVRIAQIFQKEPLDFVLFFSSIIAFTKYPGQSNYASGCTFKDAFAHQLSREWSCTVKVMNWGYWGSVGVVASKAYRERMAHIGIGSIEPPEAMKALETLFAVPIPQMVLMKTTKPSGMKGMNPNPGEWIAVYPENLHLDVQTIQESIHLPKQDSRYQRLKSGGNLRMKEMEKLLCKLMWGGLQSVGLFKEKNPLIADLKRKIGLSNLYDRWIEESTAILARKNYLQYDGKSCLVVDTTQVDMDAAWKEWDRQQEVWLKDPGKKAHVSLVETTLRALPDIITGKRPATDVIFPNSSMELVEGIYKNNPTADYVNEVLANIVVAYIQQRLQQDSPMPVRILEIGAGTGGTSVMVFKKLQPYREQIQEYCYTDISKAFLMHAEKEYGPGNPYLIFKIFDVEAPLAGQGIPAGGYDIVIAANVLHATKNIRQSLRNTKAALKKNGLILLNELSGNSLFLHLTFGLLAGWWLYEDSPLRLPGCPALSPQTWQEVMEKEGFRGIFFPAREAHEVCQQVIVAQSDGVVRQGQQLKTSGTTTKKSIKTGIRQYPGRALSSPGTWFESNETGEARGESGIQLSLLREKITAYFKKLVGETIKLPGHKIDSSEPLKKYGFDSILVVQLNNSLRKVLNNTSITLFFEYQTIDAVVEHLLETQRDSLIALLGLENKEHDIEISSGEKYFIGSSSPYPGRISGPAPIIPLSNPGIEESASSVYRIQDIAIIGLSGRYPQAKNIQEFWHHLKEGKNCITEIPGDRWDWKEFFNREKGKKGSIYTKWGGFISDIDKFDPLFFQISPAEAERMDPQERLFLEVAYASIEDAGYTPTNLGTTRKIGVFVGVMNGTYCRQSSYWSIANRISYLLNFQGPSIAVDTACSSSLTAIHLALESLYSGVSECAIAGGVNLIVKPVHYLKLAAMTMLSPGNQNKAFGDRADGFVAGEGVGAIVLKPLPKAIADGDHIYGIIKGSMLNAGGKTNGYTVPNPNAQFQLISEAFQRAGVHAGTISYLEAHGTGTALGDPIEIAGLTRAFEQDTKDKGFCALGSVKSNIGHCESAAGIAGVTKVLLQLRHGQLVPSLHSKVLNPEIDFSNTPFVVQRELAEWKPPKAEINGETREYPRRAGISSFGAGGANAHVLIEEYIPKGPEPPPITIGTQNPAIIVLSAKNEERLREQVRRLLAAIEEQKFSDTSLADVAYTLQVGRVAMEERLAVIVGSIKELREKLESFPEGLDGALDSYQGQVKHIKEALKVFTTDEDLQKAIDAWVTKGKYTKLINLWVKGLDFDWNKLYGGSKPKPHKPRRISLPTYPFARERCWAPEIEPDMAGKTATSSPAGSTAYLHPLLQQNTSDLSEQRFSSTFTGQEFFLADHVVKGQWVLPAVASLEMARVAVVQAGARPFCLNGGGESQTGVRLKNVVWARPIIVGDQPVRVHIGLFPGDNGLVSYEIYSDPGNTEAEPVVYSQGSAALISTAAPTLHLPPLKARCSQSILSSSQCCQVFKQMGFDYGPGHQGIEKVYVGQDQVLAKLSLPSSVFHTQNQFVMHPSLMDSALQASIGLTIGRGEPTLSGSTTSLKPVLPFALQELEVFSNCTPGMWALVRYSDGSKAGDKTQKLDIDLCDEQGKICVRMKGLSMRVLEGEMGLPALPATRGSLILHPCWKEQSVALEGETTPPDYVKHVVIFCEWGKVSRKKIETRLKGGHCLFLAAQQEGIDEQFQTYTARVFQEIQGILKDKPGGKVLIQVVVSIREKQYLFRGLSGLLKTARLENPKLLTQLIGMEPGEDSQGIIKKLEDNSRCPTDIEIHYQKGKRLVAGWSEVEASQIGVNIPWKDRGIYLITGGAGGLGLIFAREIARQVKEPTLILIGRSRLNKDRHTQLEELEALGARVEYQQVDVTQRNALDSLFKGIRQKLGNLHGIIHSAGVIRDNFILEKNQEELKEVLAPKVTGLVNLDQASKDLDLDIFIFFSSTAGSIGNPGQADYSAANAFMDVYAEYRNALVASKQRQGQTLSINWPLWKEGGMKVDEETQKIMLQSLGMMAMQTPTGIRALYQGLASGKHQVMVMEGKLERMKQKLLSLTVPPFTKPGKVPAASNTAADIHTSGLLEKVQAALTQTVSKLLKVKARDIDGDAQLKEYGFDSITLTEFTTKLNEEYNLELNPTIFFEYPTISSFAEYLVEEYQAVIAARFTAQTRDETPVQAKKDEAGESPVYKRRRSRFAKTVSIPAAKPGTTAPQVHEPIAIIGMSGRFPMARDLNEFWRNLAEGKDCITEIPGDRWDWREYYGDPKKEANKTNIKWGGFIDGVDEFDPLFFGISPREAALMDPQQRLLMTYVWKAVEDAGYSPQSLWGTNTGIFVATAASGYRELITRANAAIGGYTAADMVPSLGPNRMSYFLNIHGPSEPIETACSSSLVAIHRAASAIEDGSCDMAIVGGVNTIVNPDIHISFSKAGMLNEDGRCKTFSSQANGYVRGEGVGFLFLKKLNNAIVDNDHIYGIIKGTAENHGGRANSLTSPNPNAQAELIKAAVKKANIDPGTITYIETHGTGTELGDPIEINGLKIAFKELYQAAGDSRAVNAHCGLGSVKSNIGHLELSAGIAGVIKVLLQLKHKTLVKSLHCDTINPYIQLKDSPFYILQESKEWKPCKDSQGRFLPRRVGVSSFGIGGVNAHIVIEEYIPDSTSGQWAVGSGQEEPQTGTSPKYPAIIVLSAKNEERLRDQVQQLLTAIAASGQQFPNTNLLDMAYTLQVGREAMEERLAVIVDSIKELREKLKGFLEGQEGINNLYRGQVKHNKETLAALSADEDIAKTIDAWITKEKYANLIKLWLKGLVFDWNKLYGGCTPKPRKPRRISLPTYPFARERYWLPGIDNTVGSTTTSPAFQERSQFSNTPPSLELQPGTASRSSFSNTSDKPRGISLPVISAGSKPVNPLQTIISAGSLQEELAASLANALYLKRSQVDADKKFIDMGLDSIVGVEWMQTVNKQYGTSIPATRLYDYPTIGEFARLLEKELNKQGKELKQTPLKPNPSLSLHEMLQQVYEGTLDIEQADQLLHINFFKGERL